MDEYMLPCMTKRFLGMECLGCGIQRSIMLLSQGDLAAAFFMYPAIYPMMLLAGIIVTNMFFPFKYVNKVIWILGIITGIMMVGNYIWKHFV